MMLNEHAGQVLAQVQAPFRSSSLRTQEAALLAFQLLTWAHMSAAGRLSENDTLDAALAGAEGGFSEALGRLALSNDSIGHAFADAQRLCQYADHSALAAASLAAKRLTAGGIFERFSAAAIASNLLQAHSDRLSVPVELAHLMARVAASSGASSVYLPWEGGGQFLAALIDSEASAYVETPHVSSVPALLSQFRSAETKLVTSNPLSSPNAIKAGHLERFDATLSFPPMGLPMPNDDLVLQDIYGRFPVKKATATGLMIQHIIAQTSGIAAVVVPNGFIFGPGKDRDVREHLLSKGLVKAVIALPSGIHQATNIATSLLVLDTRTIHRAVGFVDATKASFRDTSVKGRTTLGRVEDIVRFCSSLAGTLLAESTPAVSEGWATVVPVEAILENDASLQVDRYVIADEQRELRARLDAIPTVDLDSVVQVINPIPNKDRGADNDNAVDVLEVGAADLPATGYISHPEKQLRIQLSPRRSGGHDDPYLRPFDILIVTKGSVGKVGVVPHDVPPPGPGGWVAGQSAVVLRSRTPSVDSRALGLWLRSPMGQILLSSIVSGATIPMISLQALRQVRIPLPALEAQRKAAEVLDNEAEIQRQIESLRAKQFDLATQLWNELFN
ncbi:N-6 DNA methylase [Silanimonas sp.]|uniref:N-6 DNA methylase n=1 Tax=Silanimonas sp. TaxID=1929290 RepID=UPI0022C30986|nr:N-6 DNA methylase [Silanimonas sp.]MCZ8064173.1 N-6 DNA methylase [Silanimonas sp.]